MIYIMRLRQIRNGSKVLLKEKKIYLINGSLNVLFIMKVGESKCSQELKKKENHHLKSMEIISILQK
jgi:hypothetical protein